MKQSSSSSRLIRPSLQAPRSARDAVDPSRRTALRMGMVALGAGLFSCSTESNAADPGTTSCDEPDPTDGTRLVTIDDGEEQEHAVIKVPTARLAENFGLMEATVDPKQLLVPHTHQFDDQIVYVIEGELEFEYGDGVTFLAPTGSFVIKPRYISHGFWNPSPTVMVRYIEMTTRSMFETFVKASTDAETKQEFDSLAADAGVELHYDQVPRLLAENKLTSIKGIDQPSPGEFVPRGGFPGA